MQTLHYNSLAFSLRFFSFVLERGKNPEIWDASWAKDLGVKLFWNVENFRKTGISALVSTRAKPKATVQTN